MNYKGQGSLEYLMLIAAAVVVVTIVISFIASAIGPVQSAGSQQQYDYLCNTLNVHNFTCGCYLCDVSRKGVSDASGKIEVPGIDTCLALAKKLNEPLLSGCNALDFK